MSAWPWPFTTVIEELQLARLKFPTDLPALVPDSSTAHAIADRAYVVATMEIGKGEHGGNNRGPDVARYCSPHGDGHLWCGGFFCWCYEEAARQLEVPMPFVKSLRAKTVGRNIAAIGRRFTDYRDAEPGDAMIIPRGAGGNHIGMVARVGGHVFSTIEGNHGATVCPVVRHPTKLPGLWFASVRR